MRSTCRLPGYDAVVMYGYYISKHCAKPQSPVYRTGGVPAVVFCRKADSAAPAIAP
ncbi:MAG: hypothetical protein P4L77_07670 [Sulfuriferula sp.]|nr:hypothetical protein [Sulfuriferula sp.]